jgi:hypothetical protein
VDCSYGAPTDQNAAAAIPSLNFSLRTEFPENFNCPYNEVEKATCQDKVVGSSFDDYGYDDYPDDSPSATPTECANLVTTEVFAANRVLLDIDLFENTKAACRGCAASVVETEWRKGVNPELWTKKVVKNGVEYQNNQLEEPTVNAGRSFNARGEFQFQETLVQDPVSVVADGLPHLFSNQGALTKSFSSGNNQWFGLGLEPITNAAPVIQKYRPGKRLLFSTNDTAVRAHVLEKRAVFGKDQEACDASSLPVCQCAEIFDRVKFEVLDGRDTLFYEAARQFLEKEIVDPESGLQKSHWSYRVLLKQTGKHVDPEGKTSFMEQCVTSTCCGASANAVSDILAAAAAARN